MFEGVCVGLMFEKVDLFLFGFGNDFTERAFDICRFKFLWVWEWFHEEKI